MYMYTICRKRAKLDDAKKINSQSLEKEATPLARDKTEDVIEKKRGRRKSALKNLVQKSPKGTSSFNIKNPLLAKVKNEKELIIDTKRVRRKSELRKSLEKSATSPKASLSSKKGDRSVEKSSLARFKDKKQHVIDTKRVKKKYGLKKGVDKSNTSRKMFLGSKKCGKSKEKQPLPKVRNKTKELIVTKHKYGLKRSVEKAKLSTKMFLSSKNGRKSMENQSLSTVKDKTDLIYTKKKYGLKKLVKKSKMSGKSIEKQSLPKVKDKTQNLIDTKRKSGLKKLVEKANLSPKMSSRSKKGETSMEKSSLATVKRDTLEVIDTNTGRKKSGLEKSVEKSSNASPKVSSSIIGEQNGKVKSKKALSGTVIKTKVNINLILHIFRADLLVQFS